MPVRMSSRVAALAAAAWLALLSSRARADEPAPAPSEEEEASPPAPAVLPPPSPPSPPSPPPMTPDPTDAPAAEPPRRSHHFVGRLGALGAYRQLYDLSILGAGAELSLGSESDRVGGHYDFHFIDARSLHGLVVLDMGMKGAAEWLVGSGWRLGFGGGVTYFGVQRATTGSFIQSVGPLALVRAGYDFGDQPGAAYLLVDFEGQLQSGPTIVWGPTLHLGVRF